MDWSMSGVHEMELINHLVHDILGKDAFDLYLDTEEFRSATDREKPSPEVAIKLIHQAGGKAVLAHPGRE